MGAIKSLKNLKNAVKDEKILHEITFNENNSEIMLDGTYLLAKPQLNSINEKIIMYLINNSNKQISKAVLQKEVGFTISNLPKNVENLGFTGDLLKVFFRVSKNTIFFRNPITKKQFQEFSIPPLKLKSKSYHKET